MCCIAAPTYILISTSIPATSTAPPCSSHDAVLTIRIFRKRELCRTAWNAAMKIVLPISLPMSLLHLKSPHLNPPAESVGILLRLIH